MQDLNPRKNLFHKRHSHSFINISHKVVTFFEEDDPTPAETQQRKQKIIRIIKPSSAQARQSYSSLYANSGRGGEGRGR